MKTGKIMKAAKIIFALFVATIICVSIPQTAFSQTEKLGSGRQPQQELGSQEMKIRALVADFV